GVELLVVLRVGDRARDHLPDRHTRRLRGELQHGQCLLRGQPAYEVDHAPRLGRGRAHEPGRGPHHRRRRWGGRCCHRVLSYLSLVLPPAALPVFLHVTAEGAGQRELAELVSDHRLGDEHRYVLAPVVDGDGVADHLRDDRRPTRPRLDHVPGALLVLGHHLLHEVVVHERALLQTAWHRFLPSTNPGCAYGCWTGAGRSACPSPCSCGGSGPPADPSG